MFSGLLTRGLLYALIVGACYLYINGLQSRAVRAELALADIKSQVAKETAVREAENKLKLERLTKDANRIETGLREQLTAIFNNSQSLLKKSEVEYENAQTTIDYLNSERDILRNEVDSYVTGMSERQNTLSVTTEIGRECDAAAFETVVKGCRVTTIDFNACRELLDANCEATGCE